MFTNRKEMATREVKRFIMGYTALCCANQIRVAHRDREQSQLLGTQLKYCFVTPIYTVGSIGLLAIDTGALGVVYIEHRLNKWDAKRRGMSKPSTFSYKGICLEVDGDGVKVLKL
jgi:hypothetical protein